ncbi:MAG TPA: glutaredoxin family protein [Symbiobacteriaceae bacterium]
MADYHVTLYTGPGNDDDVHKARRFLEERGIQYQEKDVVEHKGGRGELLHHTGRAEYPTINVDGHLVVGFFPEKWEHLVKHNDVGQT